MTILVRMYNNKRITLVLILMAQVLCILSPKFKSLEWIFYITLLGAGIITVCNIRLGNLQKDDRLYKLLDLFNHTSINTVTFISAIILLYMLDKTPMVHNYISTKTGDNIYIKTFASALFLSLCIGDSIVTIMLKKEINKYLKGDY